MNLNKEREGKRNRIEIGKVTFSIGLLPFDKTKHILSKNFIEKIKKNTETKKSKNPQRANPKGIEDSQLIAKKVTKQKPKC